MCEFYNTHVIWAYIHGTQNLVANWKALQERVFWGMQTPHPYNIPTQRQPLD